MQSQTDEALCNQIGARFAAMLDKYGVERAPIGYYARRVLLWHRDIEPLRLDMLANADISAEVDFAHDIGGIMRGDTLQSARYALAYHPRAVSA